MFESQVENYIGKVLVDEAKKEGEFLNESEIAFAVTGKMYADGIKSDGPVSLRSIKGKMGKVRQMCDEKNMLLLSITEDDTTKWKIATPKDLPYIADKYLGVKVGELEATDSSGPEVEETEGEV